MPPKHKNKRVKHFDIAGHAHELTFSCFKRKPILVDDQLRKLLSQSIDQAMTSKGYTLVAFVYMPEHVHLLVYPRPDADEIKDLLYAIKRPFSYRVKKLLEQSNSYLLDQLTVQTGGRTRFHYWQAGPGYDRNISSMTVMEKVIDYIHKNPVRRGLCVSPDQWKWSSWSSHSDSSTRVDPDLPVIHGMPV